MIVDPTGRPARSPRRGKDFATLDEVINVTMNQIGPLAVILREAMEKIARLEDALGISDETAAPDPVGTAYEALKRPEATDA